MAGQIVSVWGPTGAPGRSTVALGIATELALRGRRVGLIDADTYGGSIAGYLELFDEIPGFLAASRLAEAEKLDAVECARLSHRVVFGQYSFTVFTGLANPARWPELTPQRVRAGLAILAERFDCLVVDVGFNLEEDEEITSDLVAPRRNQATVACLKSSDVIVAVGAADVVPLARYIHALDSLRVVVAGVDVVHVINRVRRSGALSGAAQTVRNTLRRFAGIEELVLIDEDVKAYDAASVAGVPVKIAVARSSVCKQLGVLADEVIGRAQSSSQRADEELMVPAAG